MYLQNYCATAGLSILFLVGCLIHLSENDVFSSKSIRKFQRLIYVLMAEIIIDCLFVLIEGHDVEHVILYALKNIELLLNPFLSFLVFEIFYGKKKRWEDVGIDKILERIHSLLIGFIVLSAVLLALSAFGWNVFTINDAHFYTRGPLLPVYLAILSCTIIASMYGLFVISEYNTQNSLKSTLFFFAGSLFVGVGLRAFLPETNYDFLCLSVSISFLLVYYSHITLRLDPLTKLLNRQVYVRMLERINYTTIVIMIDANNFKYINDTFGHECGDRTLKEIAKLICKAYGKFAYCFRIGGDEFCIILKQDAFDELIEKVPHFDAYALSRNLMKKLDDLVSETKRRSNSF